MGDTRGTSTGNTSTACLENGQLRNNWLKRRWFRLEMACGFHQVLVMSATGAAGTITVRGNLKAEGVGAQMGHLAEKLDRRFGITAFQLAIGRAHTAKGVKAARRANRLANARSFANLV